MPQTKRPAPPCSGDRSKGNAQASFSIDIAKSHASRLRISLKDWRGVVSVDVRECTANIPGAFWPTSMGVALEISKLPKLIDALRAVEAEAIARGLLERRAPR